MAPYQSGSEDEEYDDEVEERRNISTSQVNDASLKSVLKTDLRQRTTS